VPVQCRRRAPGIPRAATPAGAAPAAVHGRGAAAAGGRGLAPATALHRAAGHAPGAGGHDRRGQRGDRRLARPLHPSPWYEERTAAACRGARLDFGRRRGRAVARRGERMQASRICLALCLAALALPAMAKQKFSWPEGRKAAVSLAYDDALDSQLDNAVPQLQKYGLKGSFYIVPAREPVRARMEEWREVARMGHELGNHSITHPCSAHGPGREWVPAHQDLDRMSLAQIKEQVEVADVFLQA